MCLHTALYYLGVDSQTCLYMYKHNYTCVKISDMPVRKVLLSTVKGVYVTNIELQNSPYLLKK